MSLRSAPALTVERRLSIGDEVALPSGRRIPVTSAPEPDRPWQAVETGDGGWHVCRLHTVQGRAGASFYFVPGRAVPLQLGQADALALAGALNHVRVRMR